MTSLREWGLVSVKNTLVCNTLRVVHLLCRSFPLVISRPTDGSALFHILCGIQPDNSIHICTSASVP